MSKYDTIDIFFISLITTYFITLLCIIITLIYIGLKKLIMAHKKAPLKVIDKKEVPKEEVKINKVKEPVINKPKVSWFSKLKNFFNKPKKEKAKKNKLKLSQVPLIQKLLLEEIPKKDVEPKKLEPTKIEIDNKQNITKEELPLSKIEKPKFNYRRT